MTIKIRRTVRGVTVRATGQDADRLIAVLVTGLQAFGLTPEEEQALKMPASRPKSIPGDPKRKAGATGAAPASDALARADRDPA